MFDVIIEKLGEFVDSLSVKWHQLTAGKRGEDDYSGFLWIAGIIFLIIDIFVKNLLLLIVGIFFVGYGLFRCFSNAGLHDKENEIFHRATGMFQNLGRKVAGIFSDKYKDFQNADKKAMVENIKNKVIPDEETKLERAEQKAMKNAYYVFECPGCKQKVRIPNRGKKGRVAIVCPACHTRFVRMRW